MEESQVIQIFGDEQKLQKQYPVTVSGAVMHGQRTVDVEIENLKYKQEKNLENLDKLNEAIRNLPDGQQVTVKVAELDVQQGIIQSSINDLANTGEQFMSATSNAFSQQDANIALLQKGLEEVISETNKALTLVENGVESLTATMQNIVTMPADDSALPLLCGQPPILFGAGTPQEAIVPDNWKQFDPETGEGYNWNGEPSAAGQQYINTSASTGGRYIAVPSADGGLTWKNF